MDKVAAGIPRDGSPSATGPALTEAIESRVCCDDLWEQAFLRFATPEQEMRGFLARLEKLRARAWPRDASIGELFRGRWNSLRVLEGFGFKKFLSFVHALCRTSQARRAVPKIDALATMIDHERATYEAWLGQPKAIIEALDRFFETVRLTTA